MIHLNPERTLPSNPSVSGQQTETIQCPGQVQLPQKPKTERSVVKVTTIKIFEKTELFLQKILLQHFNWEIFQCQIPFDRFKNDTSLKPCLILRKKLFLYIDSFSDQALNRFFTLNNLKALCQSLFRKQEQKFSICVNSLPQATPLACTTAGGSA